MSFKRGDKVIANDVSGTKLLTKGKQYEVNSVTETGVNVRCDEDRNYEFWAHRFTLAPVLDLSKPLQTKDGEPVTLISTTSRGTQPLTGYVGSRVSLTQWGADGSYFRDGSKHPSLDLINVPVKPATAEVFVNLYNAGGKLHTASSSPTRERADKIADTNRVGCIKITLVEGQWDN